MKKLLHERLREIAPRISKSGGDDWGIDELREVMNVACYSTYQSDLKNTVLAIADEIEKYYIPRPRFEDGEPIQIGDVFIQKCISEEVELDKIGIALFTKDGLNMVWFPDEVVKRPEPKVLDADGTPCKKGDTVWLTDEGTKTHRSIKQPMTVVAFYPEGAVGFLDSEGELYSAVPDVLTHREPDNLEKLRDDLLAAHDNWDGDPNALLEYADRLTAIMERDA